MTRFVVLLAALLAAAAAVQGSQATFTASKSNSSNSFVTAAKFPPTVTLTTPDRAFIPSAMSIELATRHGYAHYQQAKPFAREVTLVNDTPARVVVNPAATRNQIQSEGEVVAAQPKDRRSR